MSFLATKKKPAPRGDEDGWIMPAARDSLMYFPMASLSGRERLYNLLEGKDDPGRRSTAQSYGLWGGGGREHGLC